MNSRALVIFSKPTSFLVISVLFSLLYHVPCASSKKELGWCEGRYQCGDIIAGFPFWGGDRPEHCGLSLLELHCHKDSSTSLLISDQEFSVLDVDQTSYTLTLARADQLGPFCSSKFNTTTLPPDIFDVSPTYKNLTIFHDCDFCSTSYFSNITCGNKGRITVPKGPENQCICLQSFTVNVPSSFFQEVEVFDLQKLESVLRKGFVVKVKVDEITCQECLASGGICSFNGTTQVCCKTNLSTSGISCLPKRQPSAAELHILCSNQFRCGDQYHLLYPFWIPGREECGHPDFKLECNTFFAELYFASVKFRVLEANYTSRIIRLARSDYLGDLCPEEPSKDPYDKNGLLFKPDTELLTFYYDCRDFSFATPFYDPTYFRELDCDSLDGRSYYVTKNLSSSLLDGVRDVLNILSKWCARNVSIPAFGSALKTLQESPSPYNLKKTLEQGFELGVTRDCFLCIDSGGACGYNRKSNGFVCYCNNGPYDRTCGSRKKSHGTFIKILIGSSLLAAVLVLLVIFTLFLRKRKASHDHRKQNQKALIPLNHYSYAQVKRITKSFAEVVGKGGFGTVYKGSLFDGRCVAVKVLKDLKGNGEDFINEVASMSKTSHVNIVSLLGFCFEGSKRAIISEFLENGSLDQFISSNSSTNTNWMVLYGIALGIARGIEYLHYGCKTRIVHFDIKPSNVLLDKNLCPKVTDFGLAKLCEKKENIMSLLDTRGTIGYIAPEMISRVYGSVSHKSDVYSYGMLVLEMIGARNEPSTENSASNPSSMYFPEWIYRDLEKRDNGRIIENGISSEEEEEIVRKMTLVGLWCIQPSPLNRPPMNRVVEMMEGSLEALEIPPRPVLQQIPAAPFQESSSLLEDISV